MQLIWEAWQDKREDHSSIALDDITIRNEACEAIGEAITLPFDLMYIFIKNIYHLFTR